MSVSTDDTFHSLFCRLVNTLDKYITAFDVSVEDPNSGSREVVAHVFPNVSGGGSSGYQEVPLNT